MKKYGKKYILVLIVFSDSKFCPLYTVQKNQLIFLVITEFNQLL